MNEFENEIVNSFKESITQFLVELQTTRGINYTAFDEMHTAAQELSRILKGKDLVSKSLLNEFYLTSSTIRAESPYFENEQSILLEMADKVEWCLYLILNDEAPEDRVPGVPRVV